MISELILIWQNPNSRKWVPVGKLLYGNGKYIFKYTEGAKQEEEFVPFGRMSSLEDSYESTELFAIFKNRLLSKSRPEYSDYLNWLGLEKENVSPLEELSRTGGIRATDSLQLFKFPEKSNGRYEVKFFAHGISHLSPTYIERVKHLSEGNKLFLMKDIQNKRDHLALALRTDDPPEIVGYCPRFFIHDFTKLIEKNGEDLVEVSVVKVNLDSPVQFRLLCKLSTNWPEKFVPFSDSKDFQTINGN